MNSTGTRLSVEQGSARGLVGYTATVWRLRHVLVPATGQQKMLDFPATKPPYHESAPDRCP